MDEKEKAELKQKIGDKAYKLGYEYEKVHRGCGQCSLLALQDIFSRRNDHVFTALTGIAGGAGMLCDVGCGAYIGSVAFLGSVKGRSLDNIKDPEGVRFKTHEVVRKLHDRFIEEYGTVICRDLHMQLFGRYYYMPDPDEFKKFDDAGAHETVCTDVVGKACRWAAELVVDEELLSDDELRSAAK